jgi:hypothetical protein
LAYPEIKYVTENEYLVSKNVAFQKHEYFKGKVVAMAGATENITALWLTR